MCVGVTMHMLCRNDAFRDQTASIYSTFSGLFRLLIIQDYSINTNFESKLKLHLTRSDLRSGRSSSLFGRNQRHPSLVFVRIGMSSSPGSVVWHSLHQILRSDCSGCAGRQPDMWLRLGGWAPKSDMSSYRGDVCFPSRKI